MLTLVWRQHETEGNPEGTGLINWEELSRVNDIIQELDSEIKNVERLLPTNVAKLSRKRRGLIELGGQALKFLFGTATSSEVQELQTIISKYENQNCSCCKVAVNFTTNCR
jgi:vacuolar-type H+-ATPase subunit I/STV1